MPSHELAAWASELGRGIRFYAHHLTAGAAREAWSVTFLIINAVGIVGLGTVGSLANLWGWPVAAVVALAAAWAISSMRSVYFAQRALQQERDVLAEQLGTTREEMAAMTEADEVGAAVGELARWRPAEFDPTAAEILLRWRERLVVGTGPKPLRKLVDVNVRATLNRLVLLSLVESYAHGKWIRWRLTDLGRRVVRRLEQERQS